jgi:hypothetical protein
MYGYSPLCWDARGGRLWMEIPRLDTGMEPAAATLGGQDYIYAFLASGELPKGPALTVPEPPGAPFGKPDPEWLGPWGEWR